MSQASHPVRVSIPVAWSDMDALGHVNNGVFLRWFEDARIVYFGRVGIDFERVGVILARQSCDYLAPVVYPDTVEARVSVTRLGTKSFTMSFAISSAAAGRDVATGEGVMVAFDYESQRSVPLPAALREAIERLERGAAG